MAIYSFQVRLQGTSGFSEDVYENVLWYDVDPLATPEGTCDEIKAVYLNAGLHAGVSNIEVRAYEEAGGQPVASSGPTTSPSLGGETMPGEVACCLSYTATDDTAAATPRRRGRIFLGPLGKAFVADRPPTALVGSILDLGEALASVGVGLTTTWMLYSRRDSSAHKIEAIYVDNAWDTQRRRGLAPTARTVRDVQ